MISPGDKFGKWTVLSDSDKTDSSNNKYYTCKCECGTVRDIAGHKLRTGRTKSCGCNRSIDMTGQRTGRLTFIKRVGKDEKGRFIWECKCDCGETCQRTIGKAKTVGSCGKHTAEVAKITLDENRKKQHYVDGTLAEELTAQLSKNNTSGFKGVYWNKEKGKWVAQITFRRKNYNLGRYDNIEDAVAARKAAEERFFKPILEKVKEGKSGQNISGGQE